MISLTRHGPPTAGGQILLVLLALLSLLARPAAAIVNGVEPSDPRFNAVVYLQGPKYACTGTFVHSRLVLTAAHCIDPFAEGSVTGFTVSDGATPNSGTIYTVDRIFLPRAGELGADGKLQDVAILRTTQDFKGTPIPILPPQDLPHGAENYYCPRWEFTWPAALGFSDNAQPGTAPKRRMARAFAECDLEVHNSTTFDFIHTLGAKLDGHGRVDHQGQQIHGARICHGDSGGPAIWESGFGTLAVGGVISASDDYNLIVVDDTCPSERGEAVMSFIPQAFLDRVAASEPLCINAGARDWAACTNPNPYQGRQLRYLGTEIDQCGEDVLTIASGGGTVQLRHGETKAAEVGSNRFAWYCGTSQEFTTARAGTNFIVAKLGLSDRQIIWDSYQRGVFVPNVVGSSQANASNAITAAGLVLGPVSRVIDFAPIGTVLSQTPAQGGFVPLGTTVSISVSVGAVVVPSVLGKTPSMANTTLQNAGLNPSASSQVSCIDLGRVIAQFSDPGSKVAPGSVVSYQWDSGTTKTCKFIQ